MQQVNELIGDSTLNRMNEVHVYILVNVSIVCHIIVVILLLKNL